MAALQDVSGIKPASALYYNMFRFAVKSVNTHQPFKCAQPKMTYIDMYSLQRCVPTKYSAIVHRDMVISCGRKKTTLHIPPEGSCAW